MISRFLRFSRDRAQAAVNSKRKGRGFSRLASNHGLGGIYRSRQESFGFNSKGNLNGIRN